MQVVPPLVVSSEASQRGLARPLVVAMIEASQCRLSCPLVVAMIEASQFRWSCPLVVVVDLEHRKTRRGLVVRHCGHVGRWRPVEVKLGALL